MTLLNDLAYKEVTEKARTALESAGYRVTVRPSEGELPVFLKTATPDLIARKGEGGVVIGIRTMPADRDQAARLSQLADEVRQHEGWRFDLYLAQPRQELVDAMLQPNSGDLDAEILRGRRLLEAHEPKIALIYGWALLEAAARILVLDQTKGEAKRYRPASVVTSLISEGFLTDEDGERLQNLGLLRNQLVHGFTKADVQEGEVTWLLETVEGLLKEAKQS